jgi:hypothetical protein
MSLRLPRPIAFLLLAAAFTWTSFARAQSPPPAEAEPAREPRPRPQPEPPPPPPQPAPIGPSRVSDVMRTVLDVHSQFERARDDCDREAMDAALRTLFTLVLRTEEEADEIEAELGDGSPIPDGRSRRLDRWRRDRDATLALYEQARREAPRNCPGPPIPAPGRPGHGPAYYASLGGAWLTDHGFDAGLAQATLAVDFDLGADDDPGGPGLGASRLGPRFRLLGEVSAGVLGESEDVAGFSTDSGVEWSAIGLAGLVLPIGDAEPGDLIPQVSLFAGGGYGFARFGFELEGPGVDFSDGDTEDFFAFGAGLEARLGRSDAIRAAYTRWDDLEEDGISANLFSLSYVRRFGGGGGR